MRARVEFTQFGVKLMGSVVGISHDHPMRYDLRLEDGAIITNIPEPAIGALIALPLTPSPAETQTEVVRLSSPSPARMSPARSRAA